MNDFVYWTSDQLDLSMTDVNVLVIHKNGLGCCDLCKFLHSVQRGW